MKTVTGDLLVMAEQGSFDVIVHGCNCFNTMGAGIAKLIKDMYPVVYEADLSTEKGSKDKLGTITSAVVKVQNDHELTVVNAYTQYHYGKNSKAENGCLVDYDAIRSVFRCVKEQFAGKMIGFPLIGAGLAGGDWKIISLIIDEELDGENFTLVKFERT
eukprot:CFRG0121T1